MTVYIVYDKATGEDVYAYSNDTITSTEAYPLDQFDHVAQATTPIQPTPSNTKFGGNRHLTKLEWRKLMTEQENEDFDEMRATVETMVVPDGITRSQIRTLCNKYNESTFMDLDDPDQLLGFKLLYALGILKTPQRITEILNG